MAQHMALKAATGRVHYAGDFVMGAEYSLTEAEWRAGEKVAENVLKCMSHNVNDQTESEMCGSFLPSFLRRGCTYELAQNYNPDAREDDGSCFLYSLAPSTYADKIQIRLMLLFVIIGVTNNILLETLA